MIIAKIVRPRNTSRDVNRVSRAIEVVAEVRSARTTASVNEILPYEHAPFLDSIGNLTAEIRQSATPGRPFFSSGRYTMPLCCGPRRLGRLVRLPTTYKRKSFWVVNGFHSQIDV